MARSDIFTPDFKAKPYWWELAEPAAEAKGDLPSRADVVVVGGGYAGLSAALELARRGTDVVVLEAERIGSQASSRNGGLIGGSLKPSAGELREKFGPARAAGLVREAAGTLDFVAGLIERENIDCRLRQQGRFVCACSDKQYDRMAAGVDDVARVTGKPAYMVPARDQRREIGSDRYSGGMAVDAAASLHPALYVQGLAGAARKAGARLCDNTRVTKLERQSSEWAVMTTSGVIRAREVLLATNGYTDEVNPWFRRRLIPVASFMIATEELPQGLAKQLVPTDRVFSETRRVLNYFRLSPDGRRMLWGGRVGVSYMNPRTSAARLHNVMSKTWPELEKVKVSHSWHGNVAFSLDFLPHLGVERGIHYALGCQGSGVGMQTYLGHRAALKIAGVDDDPSAFDGLPFPSIPFYSGDPWFLPGVLCWYRLRDFVDRLGL